MIQSRNLGQQGSIDEMQTVACLVLGAVNAYITLDIISLDHGKKGGHVISRRLLNLMPLFQSRISSTYNILINMHQVSSVISLHLQTISDVFIYLMLELSSFLCRQLPLFIFTALGGMEENSWQWRRYDFCKVFHRDFAFVLSCLFTWNINCISL